MANETYRVGPLTFAHAGDKPCLDMPGFEIMKGRVTVIAGENGSGKTTLLKLLAGLLNASETKQAGDSLTAICRSAVYLHQTPYLFQGTVARNLSLAQGRPGRQNASGEQVDALGQALDSVGLSGFADRRARSLSGGEGKRVALARVFLSNRPLLLLDEPAAHADDNSVRLIEVACRDFAGEGRTVVIATHRGSFGYRVADALFDLRDGRLEPGSLNILRGEIVGDDSGFLHFRSGSGEILTPMRDGSYQVAVVAGEDVLLSRHPLESSARNCLPGTLRALEPRADGVLFARLDCGMDLVSVITSAAAAELGLEPGVDVFATFKASSVRLY